MTKILKGWRALKALEEGRELEQRMPNGEVRAYRIDKMNGALCSRNITGLWQEVTFPIDHFRELEFHLLPVRLSTPEDVLAVLQRGEKIRHRDWEEGRFAKMRVGLGEQQVSVHVYREGAIVAGLSVGALLQGGWQVYDEEDIS